MTKNFVCFFRLLTNYVVDGQDVDIRPWYCFLRLLPLTLTLLELVWDAFDVGVVVTVAASLSMSRHDGSLGVGIFRLYVDWIKSSADIFSFCCKDFNLTVFLNGFAGVTLGTHSSEMLKRNGVNKTVLLIRERKLTYLEDSTWSNILLTLRRSSWSLLSALWRLWCFSLCLLHCSSWSICCPGPPLWTSQRSRINVL